MKILPQLALWSALVLAASPLMAADATPAWTEKAVAPDGSMTANASAWDRGAGNYCEVTVRGKQGELYRDTFQVDRDIRYFRFSWAPDSKSLLVGEGYKGAMDLTLVRFGKGKPQVAHFDSDKLMNAPLLKTLPFNDRTKNSAPNAAVTWDSLQWKASRCLMTYWFHGIGYDGTANLQIDWSRSAPELKILKITPKPEQS